MTKSDDDTPIDEVGRSFERVWKKHDRIAKKKGYVATPPGRALLDRMLQPLMEAIIVERRDEHNPAYKKMERRVIARRVKSGAGAETRRRPLTVLDAIKHLDHLNVATRILHVAINLVSDPSLGRNKKAGVRNPAKIIGRNLDQTNDAMAFKVGHWAIGLLKEFGFAETEDGDLCLPIVDGDDLDLLLTGTIARDAFRRPDILPSPFAPKPWTGFRDGGLPQSQSWARPELIITHGKRDIETAVRQAIKDGRMNPFLRAINYLQNVAFTINAPVLDWVEQYGLTMPGFKDIASFGSPPHTKNGKKREKWWPGSEPYIEAQRQQTFLVAMRRARLIIGGGSCYVPLHADTRGRLYGIPHFWFGREDYIRGLFLFRDGERIGDDGLKWLRARVARCADGWNGEKTKYLDLEGRAAWAEANIERIREIAEAVERCELISGLPDEPVQFLAACVELKKAGSNPDFKTHLPISLDATCSGVQHYAALTRCEPEGRLANLVPTGEREDLYQVVGDQVGEKRKVAKQPCVSYLYGSAPGHWEPVFDRKAAPVLDKDGKQKHRPTSGMIQEMIKFLRAEHLPTTDVTKRVHAINKAIKRTIPQTDKTRGFLKKVANFYKSEGKMLAWETMIPVINYYYAPITNRTETSYGRSRKTASFTEGYDRDKALAQAGTAAPVNFIHSLDAMHMHKVALAAELEGIAMVGVHDAFSCLASRARRFHRIIGEQFRDLYQRGWLDELFQAAKRDLQEDCSYKIGCCTVRLSKLKPPEYGTLDLDGVPLSFFAYS